MVAELRPSRSTSATKSPRTTPQFLILGGTRAISLAAVKGAHRRAYWTMDGEHQIVDVVLELTGGREVTVRGAEAEVVWKVIEQHQAGRQARR
jgi:hypothetical protein